MSTTEKLALAAAGVYIAAMAAVSWRFKLYGALVWARSSNGDPYYD